MGVVDMRSAPTLQRGAVHKTVEGGIGLAARTKSVAAIAASHASAVDRDARFPIEAIQAAKAHNLLGLLTPRDLGGEGASLGEVADVCYALGRACASTAMIYAMHQTKVACLVRHARGNPWQDNLLRRLHTEQLLLASSTTEGKGGGNVRSSEAPIAVLDGRLSLHRNATVISYGAQADGIVTTARRSAEAAHSDQVLVALLKEDYTLEHLNGWDTLGMRGTCSAGFDLKATGLTDQVVAEPYDTIHVRTMTPTAHLTWASAWAGIAAAAVERAQVFLRKSARAAGGQWPPGAPHFTKAQGSLRMLRGIIATALRDYEAACLDDDKMASIDFQTGITLLKVDASELAVSTVLSALRACGLTGYRNDSECSIGRHLRDVLSSPLMINNDRILANVMTASLMSAVPVSLRD